MNTVKSKFILLFGPIVLFSLVCNSADRDAQKQQSKGKQEFVLKECRRSLQDESFFRTITVLPLETRMGKRAVSSSRIYMDDGNIFLLDKGNEFVGIYNKEGHHVKTIQQIGRGVQEFGKLADICLDIVHKELIVLASDPSKILYYSYQGEFLRESALPTYFESITTDGTFLYLLDQNVIKGENELTIYDRNLKEVGEALKVQTQFKGRSLFQRPSPIPNHSMTQDRRIHIAQQFDNKIYTVEKGKVFPEYTLNFKQSTLPMTLLEKKMRPSEFMKICKENDYVTSITNVVENDNYLFFDTNVGFCVCNKQDGTMIKYGSISGILPTSSSGRMQPVGNANNKMAVAWPLSLFERISGIGDPLESGRVLKLSEQFKDLDTDQFNAILVVCEF